MSGAQRDDAAATPEAAADRTPAPRVRGHRLEVAWLFARVLAELAIAPLHLIAFVLRRRAHREAFRRALTEGRR